MENKHRAQISLLGDKIKNIHLEIIQKFSEKDTLPITIYKPFVNQYRKLRQLSHELPPKIEQYKKMHMRNQQLSELINISPEK